MNCEFCNKSFSTKSSLSLHQKTARYCLRLRETESKEDFVCDYCSKTFANNHRLISHREICEKKNNISLVYEEQIRHLKQLLEEEKERCRQLQETVSSIALNQKGTTMTINSTNTNNTVNNNNKIYALNLNDPDAMSKFLEENLDKKVVGGGQKALAELLANKYLIHEDGNKLYKCTDPSRQTFEYINTDGYVEKDVKAIKLKKALIKGNVQEKAAEIGPQLWTGEDGSFDQERQNFYILNVSEIMNIENDDHKLRTELTKLVS